MLLTPVIVFLTAARIASAQCGGCTPATNVALTDFSDAETDASNLAFYVNLIPTAGPATIAEFNVRDGVMFLRIIDTQLHLQDVHAALVTLTADVLTARNSLMVIASKS